MAYARNQFGLLADARCPHCQASMSLSPEDEARGKRPICLNACMLPTWQYREMQAGLRAAQAHVEAQDKEAGNRSTTPA